MCEHGTSSKTFFVFFFLTFVAALAPPLPSSFLHFSLFTHRLDQQKTTLKHSHTRLGGLLRSSLSSLVVVGNGINFLFVSLVTSSPLLTLLSLSLFALFSLSLSSLSFNLSLSNLIVSTFAICSFFKYDV